jgi:hypothetical protein
MTTKAYFAAEHGPERDAYLESLTPEAPLQLGIAPSTRCFIMPPRPCEGGIRAQ